MEQSGTSGAHAFARSNSMAPMSEMNAAARKKARFWDRLAARYARKPVPDETVYQRKLETTRRYLSPQTSVLEFGCGTGSTAISHAPFVRDIRAIDISSKMLDIARGKAAAANVDNVRFEQATLDDIDARPATYDAVLALSILHLLEDWPGAIERSYALLKPGGVFVSSTPCLAEANAAAKLLLPLGHRIGLLPYLAFFDRGTFEQKLVCTGFELDHVWQPGPRQAVFIAAIKPAG